MTELKITQEMFRAAFAIPQSAKLVLISPCGGMAECDVGHEIEPDEYVEATWARRIGIAAEQAAASVPSCETQNVCADCGRPAACVGRYEGMTEDAYACDICCGHGNEDGRCRPVEAAYDDHLDGGARSLDASESLREARVQGMREGLDIAKGQACAYSCGEAPGLEIEIDYEAADEAVDAAIEAVRKGER